MDGFQSMLDNGHEFLHMVTMTLDIVVHIAHAHCGPRGQCVFKALDIAALCVHNALRTLGSAH